MTDKDPKDFTASEQLRWAANGEPYNGIDENIWTYPTGKIRALAEAVTGEWPSDNEIFSIVADKIDAELAEARGEALRQGSRAVGQGQRLARLQAGRGLRGMARTLRHTAPPIRGRGAGAVRRRHGRAGRR